jgi:hypothetical protein
MINTVAGKSMFKNFSLRVAWTSFAADGVLNVMKMTSAASPPTGRLIQKHL